MRKSHCWHTTSQPVYAIPNPPRTQRCCHCGWFRKVTWDRNADSGHGPFTENQGAYVAGEPFPDPERIHASVPTCAPEGTEHWFGATHMLALNDPEEAE